MSKEKRQMIGPYFIQTMTKDKMIEFVDRARRTRSEHGFKLCLNGRNKNIVAGTPCKGKECNLDTTSQCKDNEKPVGIFYTHPYLHMQEHPLEDLRNIRSNLISCIGTSEEIKCFKRKKEDFDLSEHDEIIRLIENQKNLVELESKRLYTNKIILKTYHETEEKSKKEMNRLINSYFDVVSIKK